MAAIMAGHMPALADLALDVAGLLVIAGLLYFLIMMVVDGDRRA